MSVVTYLQDRASGAVLSDDEKSSINTSITTLASRLSAHFGSGDDGLANHFRFGSSTRSTILPRRIDGRSDIDYMIVFKKGGYKPQTYLDRLKRFAEQRYKSSELYQSSPTVVLELNHIKFDLVPALHSWGSNYEIPNGSNAWQYSDPNDFNKTLDDKNASELWMIKPTVRLAKIWNVTNGYVFDSYLLEKWIVGLSFYGVSNQRDYLFTVFDNMWANQAAQWRNDAINRAKGIVEKVRQYERDEMPYTAEGEVKKLIPA